MADLNPRAQETQHDDVDVAAKREVLEAVIEHVDSDVELLLGLVPIAVFALLVQKRIRSGWLLLPLALLAWVLIHESGVHATIAGVVLGLLTPATPFQRPHDVSHEARRTRTFPLATAEAKGRERLTLSPVARSPVKS